MVEDRLYTLSEIGAFDSMDVFDISELKDKVLKSTETTFYKPADGPFQYEYPVHDCYLCQYALEQRRIEHEQIIAGERPDDTADMPYDRFSFCKCCPLVKQFGKTCFKLSFNEYSFEDEDETSIEDNLVFAGHVAQLEEVKEDEDQ